MMLTRFCHGHSNADEALSRTPIGWPRLLRSKADWEYYTTYVLFISIYELNSDFTGLLQSPTNAEHEIVALATWQAVGRFYLH